MRHLLILFLAIIFSSGCADYTVRKYGKVDKNDRSIIITGFSKSLPEIKWALRKDGWKVKYDSDGTHQTGQTGATTDLKTQTHYNARYRLKLHELVRDGMWVIQLELYVIDNETQEEVIYIMADSMGAGGAHPSDTAKELVNALNEISE